MAFAAARMILKDKRRKSKEDFAPPRQRSKVEALQKHMFLSFWHFCLIVLTTHINTFHLFFLQNGWWCSCYEEIYSCSSTMEWKVGRSVKTRRWLLRNKRGFGRYVKYLLSTFLLFVALYCPPYTSHPWGVIIMRRKIKPEKRLQKTSKYKSEEINFSL